MNFTEELSLQIRSEYPIIFVETIDEEYVLQQLEKIALELKMPSFIWSLTEGLRRQGHANNSEFYKTQDITIMLQTLSHLAHSKPHDNGGIFILKDFHRHLENELTLRMFKDFVLQVKETKDTVVLIGPGYKLPSDIQPYAGHITGGLPQEQEIKILLNHGIIRLTQRDPGIKVLLSPEDADLIVRSLKGLTCYQIKTVINQLVADDRIFDIKDLDVLEEYKKKLFDREGLLEFCSSEQRGSIAGLNNLKNWLEERSISFNNQLVALPPPKGVLLMGVQGCGKSLAVKVIANMLRLPLYRLDMGRLYSSYIGETEQNLRKALGIVEQLSPICLWLDEIEKGFSTSNGQADGGVSQRLLGTFLTWMQEREAKCFLAATANNISQLPPEFLRKGRFDEVFFVDLPDAKIRSEIFRIHLEKRELPVGNIDLDLLAIQSDGFSGAEIEQVIISVMYRVASQRTSVSTEHILDGIKRTKPLAILRKEEVQQLRMWAFDRTVTA